MMRRVALWCAVLFLAAGCGDDGSPSPGDEDTPFFAPRVVEPAPPLAPLIENVFARKSTPLHGEWPYIVDQLKIGDASPLLRGGVGRNLEASPGELLEYAFSDAKTLRVPGDWNTQHPELFWYRGVIWLRKELDLRPAPGKRYFLYFGGANFAKDVYLNGNLVARHRGGFTPFNTEVTDDLVEGQNAVVVKVDSQSTPTDVPTEYNDWLNYGGITREVLLIEVPATFIRSYGIQLERGDRDHLVGWVQLDGPNRKASVQIRVPELDVALALEANRQGIARFAVDATIERWSPQNPKLYRVELAAGEDRVADEIGFRTIETRGEEILLNGEPIFLRGVSMHEESLLHPGRAYGAEDAEAAIQLARELNANFLRLAHYPHNEHMVRAADRAGILLWAELPVYHNIRFSDPETLAQAKRQFSELIARDRNRAAVAFWSIGNETPITKARNAFMEALAQHVREEDPTRPIAAALLGFDGMEEVGGYVGRTLATEKSFLARLFGKPGPVALVIGDPLGEIVDVIGYNEYLGWYMSGFIAEGMREKGLDVTEAEVRETMLREMVNFSIDTKFGKPLIISEFGAGAKQGKHGGPLDVWSEEYQARVYQSQLAMLENIGPLRGLSPWVLKDFRAPYRLQTEVQDYWNRKGLVSESGVKKLAFEVLRESYRQRIAAEERGKGRASE